MLEELKCEECGEPIIDPDEGWVEWEKHMASGKCSGLRIVHHLSASPKLAKGGCYRPDKVGYLRLDHHLTVFLGPSGNAAKLLDFREVESGYLFESAEEAQLAAVKLIQAQWAFAGEKMEGTKTKSGPQ
jgi:hypothetical protein